MHHNELAEQDFKKKKINKIITCAEPVLGTSLQTPAVQILPSWKHLLRKPYATACLHGAAPAGHCRSASLRAQALLLPTSAAGSGCPGCFAGCPSAGSPAHQPSAKTLAAPHFSSCPVCGCLAWGVKPHRLFLLGCDSQTLAGVAAADSEHPPNESGSQYAGVVGLLCQKRAGAPQD